MSVATQAVVLPGSSVQEIERRVFVLTKSGNVIELRDGKKSAISDKDLRESVAWCHDGGRWIPRGENHPPEARGSVWICNHAFCVRPADSGPCSWWIDSKGQVRCDRMSLLGSYGPAIYSGDADDPPIVDASCRDYVLHPITLRSGKVLG